MTRLEVLREEYEAYGVVTEVVFFARDIDKLLTVAERVSADVAAPRGSIPFVCPICKRSNAAGEVSHADDCSLAYLEGEADARP